jgi:uncharacterized peroxidase-related enzyme
VTSFPIHTAETAPEGSKNLLEATRKRVGMIPNLYGALAEAPIAVEAYDKLGDMLRRSSLTPTERHVAWFAINAYHDCSYCMAAHTRMAKGEKVADDVIETARAGSAYENAKLEALRIFTLTLTEDRGRVSPEGLETFLAAGFIKQNVLELVVLIAHKVVSNYTNHLVDTPVDEAFAPFAWEKTAPDAA